MVLCEIADKMKAETKKVIHKPLSLEEVYELIYNAKLCVGMRYHSVLFQSYINGNNYIVDYTDTKSGKTIGFIKDIDPNGFYNDRYIAVAQVLEGGRLLPSDSNARYKYNPAFAQDAIMFYRDKILRILGRSKG